MIRDLSVKKVLTYKKYQDLVDMKSLECKCSLMGSIVVCICSMFVLKSSPIETINNMFTALTKDVAVALIGFLGFTVTGLAILTGVISQKIVQKISDVNKKSVLERILLSFYFLGLVTACTIIGLIVLYIISLSNYQYNIKIVLACVFTFAYLVIFDVFYAVKLIGNCLEIFFIVNEIDEKQVVNKSEIKQQYNALRITALERVCLTHMDIDGYNEYKNTIKEQIELSDTNRIQLMNLFHEHFRE